MRETSLVGRHPLGSGNRVRAMTLIELLVSIAVIALLVGILLPAVVAVRRASDGLRCANNLRQLGIAIHGYEAAWGGFPPDESNGRVGNTRRGKHYALQALILPQIEQANIYNLINFETTGIQLSDLGDENATVSKMRVGTFLCPADPYVDQTGVGALSYRGNLGVCNVCDQSFSGAFHPFGLGVLSSFRDGLSNTMAFSEKPVSQSANAAYSPFRDWIDASRSPAPGSADEWLAVCQAQRKPVFSKADSGRTWLLAEAYYAFYFSAGTPNSLIPDCGSPFYGGIGVFSARSYHDGIVNVGMADGSVRRIGGSIQLPVWRALSTRNGGEPASGD